MSIKKIVSVILIMIAKNFLPLIGFESAEHMVIGDLVKLQFPDGKSCTSLKLSNDLEVSYGEIVALGGDYFAVLEFPISQGKTIDDQKQRFLNAFNTLAISNLAPKIALELITLFKNTLENIKEGEKEGKSASEVYDELGDSLLKRCNVITGGGSFTSPMFPFGTSTLQLLSEANWDHFVPNSLLAYQAGHLVAIDKAIEGGKMNGSEDRSNTLKQAYAMNAFACHYLSDSFSSGHMRTPRKKLSEHEDFECIATLLMDYMHGEDSKVGLKVKNVNDDEWIAYGDGYYFNSENAFSRSLLEQIMQISADEIYFAFQYGIDPNEGKMSKPIHRLLPQFSLLVDQNNPFNTAPLFLFDTKDDLLKRRDDINALYSYEWKSDWWGWTTLIDLSAYYRPLTSKQKALHEAIYMYTELQNSGRK